MKINKLLNTQKLQEVIPAAKYLLGCYIVREYNGQKLVGKIVETEAYHQHDPASHSFKGKTARTAAMFGPAGFAYVYFTYGMHWCMNVTCGPTGEGAAVLIRAVEPLEGLDVMQSLRGNAPVSQLTNGPAKFAQAFAINKTLYGHNLSQPPLQIIEGHPVPDTAITTSTRIGISQATDELLRFYLTGNKFLSKR